MEEHGRLLWLLLFCLVRLRGWWLVWRLSTPLLLAATPLLPPTCLHRTACLLLLLTALLVRLGCVLLQAQCWIMWAHPRCA